MIIADTHIHLYSEEYKEDAELLMKSAAIMGVRKFFMPNIDSTSIAGMLEMEKNFPGICVPMMGLHPCSVKENWKDEMTLVEEWLSKRTFVAVGEIGIDLYWDKTFIEEQKSAFRIQVELANQYKLPIVIHTRESFDETYELLREVKKEAPYGIFHCFTGTIDQAKKAIDRGFYLGIGGVATFKNGGLDKVLSEIDLKHIVLETDGPFLAPVPYRGKRNEPAYILKVAEKISEIKGISLEEVAKVTYQNTINLFGE